MPKTQGLLVDYQWCSGCQSCEIACRNEHEWELGSYGVKVLELGPYEMPDKNGLVEWDYVPTLTTLCDLCAKRLDRGELPSCQLHCLAGVIQSGTLEELAEQAAELKTRGRSKLMLLIP
jgi:anaerobic dimethyl sulfoxide reductase subunit B (iron-sulfur subunit)